MDERKPSDAAERIVVRTPEGMRDRLNTLARENGRSANAEVVKALEAWLAYDPQAEPAFLHLPERLRERVTAAAHLNGRSVLQELVARVADSFAPVAQRHAEGDASDLRALIRDAMHEAVEGLIGDPEKLKLIGVRPKQGRGEPSDG